MNAKEATTAQAMEQVHTARLTLALVQRGRRVSLRGPSQRVRGPGPVRLR